MLPLLLALAAGVLGIKLFVSQDSLPVAQETFAATVDLAPSVEVPRVENDRLAAPVELELPVPIEPAPAEPQVNDRLALLGNPADIPIPRLDPENVRFNETPGVIELQQFLDNPNTCPRYAELKPEERAWLHERLNARKRRIDELYATWNKYSVELMERKVAADEYERPGGDPHGGERRPGSFSVSFGKADGRHGRVYIFPGEDAGVDRTYREIELHYAAALSELAQFCAN